MHELPGVMFVNNLVGLEINGSMWTLRFEFMMYVMVLVLGVLRLLTLPGPDRAAGARPRLPAIRRGARTSLGGWGWLLGFFATGMILYKLRADADL